MTKLTQLELAVPKGCFETSGHRWTGHPLPPPPPLPESNKTLFCVNLILGLDDARERQSGGLGLWWLGRGRGRGPGAYIVFHQTLNGVTHQAHLPIFGPVTHHSRAADRAPRLCDLSTPSLKCLRVGGVRRVLELGGVGVGKASRHCSGGACEGFRRLL